ncbi:MAG TPA: hypothetical protein PLV78_09830 [Deltaproteobacteria bacterium]|nr:hypothetical protein [Deltaproteobacteria bacterium]
MDLNRITYEHQGRRTVIHTPFSTEGIEKFKEALIEKNFIIANNIALRRFHFSTNDWPILITFSPHEDFFELTASMYIPWFWFLINALVIILVPPVLWYLILPIQIGMFLEFTTVYLLIVGVICYLTFNRKGAKPKHIFDLSPRDSWQNLPRKKWNRILKDLLEKNFHVWVDEIG